MIPTVLTRCLKGCAIGVNIACVYIAFSDYVCEFSLLHGTSMAPTISDNRGRMCLIISECISVKRRTLKNGDIVNAISPRNPDKAICKRIAAMEGEIVLNGEGRNIKVPKGHVWLLGDNPKTSHDSRNYGPVAYGLIKSRVLYQIFPFTYFKRVK